METYYYYCCAISRGGFRGNILKTSALVYFIRRTEHDLGVFAKHIPVNIRTGVWKNTNINYIHKYYFRSSVPAHIKRHVLRATLFCIKPGGFKIIIILTIINYQVLYQEKFLDLSPNYMDEHRWKPLNFYPI